MPEPAIERLSKRLDHLLGIIGERWEEVEAWAELTDRARWAEADLSEMKRHVQTLERDLAKARKEIKAYKADGLVRRVIEGRKELTDA